MSRVKNVSGSGASRRRKPESSTDKRGCWRQNECGAKRGRQGAGEEVVGLRRRETRSYFKRSNYATNELNRIRSEHKFSTGQENAEVWQRMKSQEAAGFSDVEIS